MNASISAPETPSARLFIGPCELLTTENTLVFKAHKVRLEPKVTQVLLVLSQRKNSVVTRDTLIEEVWKGRSVTDDAINRCISRLRKVFNEELNAPITIETLATIGYRLKAGGSAHKQSTLIKRFVPVTGLLLLLLGIFLIDFTNNRVSNDNYQRKALVVSEQWERYPEFNTDGSLLTYSQGSPDTGMAVYIEQFDGAGKLRLTPQVRYDHQPTFSPDGKSIAFARLQPNGCEVRLIPIIGGHETLLGQCYDKGVSDLAWTPDGKNLWLVTRKQSLQPGRLLSLDINTRLLSDITPQFAEGVDDLAISKNGKVAISVHFDLGVEDIFISHIDQLDTWQRLTQHSVKVHGLSWAADSERLLFTSNKAGPFELWQIDIAEGVTKRIPSALTGGDALSLHPKGHILLERWQQASQVILVNKDNKTETILIGEKGVSWDAQFAPNNEQFAFVSDRSGSAELWLRNAEQDRKLTQYNGPWVMSPRWSPNGKQIAFTVPISKRFQIEIYDLESNRLLKNLAEPESVSPAWSADGEALYFGSKRSGSWQIYKKNLTTRNTQQITHNGGKVAQPSIDDQFLYFTKSDNAGIWRLRLDRASTEEKIISNLAPVDWNNWRLIGNSIYYVRRKSETTPTLYQFNTITKETLAVKKLNNFLYFSGINFDKQGNFTYSRITMEDSDIDLIRL